MHTVALIVLLLVAAERLYELSRASRNTKALLARGGQEYGADHYLLIVMLHATWLVSIGIELFLFPDFVPSDASVFWPLLILFLLLQPLRLWVLATLGPYWTTRVIRVPGAPIVREGPYRFLRHPNYLIVLAEIALLPAALGLWGLVIVFSLANAAVLILRLRVENQALAATAGPEQA